MRFINTFIYSNRWPVKILRHTLFWGVDMINWLMVKSIGSDISIQDVYLFLATVPLAMAVSYLIMYYLIPEYSANNQTRLFIYILLILVAMGFLYRVYTWYALTSWFNQPPMMFMEVFRLPELIREIFKWLSVIGLAVAIKLIKNRSELQQRNEELLKEKRAAELSFLKLQMHPHFLFNTLNTLYSQSLRNSNNESDVVMHLSNLMRFILDECQKPLIPLQQEIKVMRDYISLEKLRHGDRLQVSLKSTSNNPLISPLLFLPFVENSFKHSLSRVRGPVQIQIEVSAADGYIELVVENSNSEMNGSSASSSGQGIINVRRQLDLIYNQSYTLTIKEMKDRFRVELKVPQMQTNDESELHPD